jgi:hypothetical protein
VGVGEEPTACLCWGSRACLGVGRREDWHISIRLSCSWVLLHLLLLILQLLELSLNLTDPSDRLRQNPAQCRPSPPPAPPPAYTLLLGCRRSASCVVWFCCWWFCCAPEGRSGRSIRRRRPQQQQKQTQKQRWHRHRRRRHRRRRRPIQPLHGRDNWTRRRRTAEARLQPLPSPQRQRQQQHPLHHHPHRQLHPRGAAPSSTSLRSWWWRGSRPTTVSRPSPTPVRFRTGPKGLAMMIYSCC